MGGPCDDFRCIALAILVAIQTLACGAVTYLRIRTRMKHYRTILDAFIVGVAIQCCSDLLIIFEAVETSSLVLHLLKGCVLLPFILGILMCYTFNGVIRLVAVVAVLFEVIGAALLWVIVSSAIDNMLSGAMSILLGATCEYTIRTRRDQFNALMEKIRRSYRHRERKIRMSQLRDGSQLRSVSSLRASPRSKAAIGTSLRRKTKLKLHANLVRGLSPQRSPKSQSSNQQEQMQHQRQQRHDRPGQAASPQNSKMLGWLNQTGTTVVIHSIDSTGHASSASMTQSPNQQESWRSQTGPLVSGRYASKPNKSLNKTSTWSTRRCHSHLMNAVRRDLSPDHDRRQSVPNKSTKSPRFPNACGQEDQKSIRHKDSRSPTSKSSEHAKSFELTSTTRSGLESPKHQETKQYSPKSFKSRQPHRPEWLRESKDSQMLKPRVKRLDSPSSSREANSSEEPADNKTSEESESQCDNDDPPKDSRARKLKKTIQNSELLIRTSDYVRKVLQVTFLVRAAAFFILGILHFSKLLRTPIDIHVDRVLLLVSGFLVCNSLRELDNTRG